MLEVRELDHSYGRNQVLFNIDFSVAEGEVLGFLGPNGAGKSTTMRILAGYLTPTGGSVAFDGMDIGKEPLALRKRLGYMPENTALYPELTVGEYLSWVARVKNSDDPRRQTEETMDICALSHMQNVLIRHLSKGYRQRVGLAQAMLGPVKLLILDEPTSGLDPSQIREIRSLIRRLARDKTVILSTHILQEVELTCDRALIINKGRIVAEDTPANLARRGGGDRSLLRLDVADVDEDSVIADISSRSYIKTVRKEEAGPAGGLLLMLETDGDGDHRADIVADSVRNGQPVLEFSPLRTGLEEAFISLTAEEQAEAGLAQSTTDPNS